MDSKSQKTSRQRSVRVSRRRSPSRSPSRSRSRSPSRKSRAHAVLRRKSPPPKQGWSNTQMAMAAVAMAAIGYKAPEILEYLKATYSKVDITELKNIVTTAIAQVKDYTSNMPAYASSFFSSSPSPTPPPLTTSGKKRRFI